MKKCSEIKELISLYIDDELELDQRIELEEHIDSCEECRNELDELKQVVGLCGNIAEEELPDNFKIELHQKLLEVKKQSEERVKTMFYRSKYLKLFTSVAAVFLLVFLIKGFYKFDLFPNGKADQSAEKNNMMAAKAPAEDRVQKYGAMDITGDAGSSMKKSEAAVPDTNDADKGTQAASTEIDRSTTGGREPQIALAAVRAGESVTRNTTSITITVDDPEKHVESVKAVAAENSGLEQTNVKSNGTEAANTAEADGSPILFVNIPNTQMNAFIEALSAGYGQSNVQPQAVIAEDMSAALEDLLKQSDNLDTQIGKMDNADDANADDLNKLKEQKTEIQNKIDTIRLESDITIVKIILKKK